ncbi:MAG: 5-guanidino-2-oxopentanoate decarboxylase [Halieaceae bacterium]|jgi:acetolactate synthase-1/2/3 large subunit|nr:5-guanidino-2-oxopentanoate decarboxylase [Halieaceae bacterium]
MATCGEVLVSMLEAYGVELVFGIPGVHTIELYRGLPNTGIRHITPRHEQGAGFMADGYARVTGKPGVCLIITGPGMTNIATAMGQALADSVPMLVISSVSRSYQLGMGEGRLHEMRNQGATLSGVSVFSHTLMRADELPQILARAFGVFASERPGPVHLEIPLDIIVSTADHLDQTPYTLPAPPGAAPGAIRQAASLLAQARRPLIAIGGGSVKAATELVALAEKIGSPVINTVNAKGVIPYSHPLAVGASGSCGEIRRELEQADVVLAVGTEFGETDYDFFFKGPLVVNGQLIRIDIDPRQLTRNIRADLAICSDAQLALDAICSQLPATVADNSAGVARAAALRASLAGSRNSRYEAFFAAVREALPEVIIVGDSTQPTYYAWLNYETEGPRRYFHSASGFGTLGYAIPAAIGARLGRPDSPVIGLIGDGASQFTIAELASAVEARVPVIFLLWNNSGYAEIKRFMEEGDIVPIGVDIFTPDFVGIGRAFGCEATRVEDLGELRSALVAASTRDMPTLIEIVQREFVDGYPMAN